MPQSLHARLQRPLEIPWDSEETGGNQKKKKRVEGHQTVSSELQKNLLTQTREHHDLTIATNIYPNR